MNWGRRITIFGVLMAIISATPALLIYAFPLLGDGFFGTVALLLTVTVTPLGVVVASAGVFLQLLAAVRRRGRP